MRLGEVKVEECLALDSNTGTENQGGTISMDKNINIHNQACNHHAFKHLESPPTLIIPLNIPLNHRSSHTANPP